MEFTHEYSSSLNNWHNGATLVQFKLTELRSDRPFFCSFKRHGLTWTSRGLPPGRGLPQRWTRPSQFLFL